MYCCLWFLPCSLEKFSCNSRLHKLNMAVEIANPETAVPFTEMDTASQVLTSWVDFKALNITKSMFSDAYKEKLAKEQNLMMFISMTT